MLESSLKKSKIEVTNDNITEEIFHPYDPRLITKDSSIKWFKEGCDINSDNFPSETRLVDTENGEFLGYRGQLKRGDTPIIGFCESQGRRPSQEDRLFIKLEEKLKLLSDDQFELLLKGIIHDLANDPEIKYTKNQGTCVLLTIAVNNKAYVAHLGDSTAYAVSFTQDYKQAKSELINKNLHSAKNPVEINRIQAIPKAFIAGNRLAGELAITHGLANHQLIEYGLSVKPDFFKYDFGNNSDHNYLLLACDGLTEQCKPASQSIYEDPKLNQDQLYLFAANSKHKIPLCDMASHLTLQAIEQGSNDNVSTVAIPIELCDSIFTAIYDSHGGHEVSQLCYEKTPGLLEKYLNFIITGKLTSLEQLYEYTELLNPGSDSDTTVSFSPPISPIDPSQNYFDSPPLCNFFPEPRQQTKPDDPKDPPSSPVFTKRSKLETE